MNVETVESAAPDLTTSGPLPEPPRIADPLPLGLTGFGVSVLLLSLTQAGLIAPSSLPVSVLAISLTAGGLVHIIAGVLHFVRGEQFPGTVFLTYATFWLSYVLIVQVYSPDVVAAGGDPTAAIGWFLTAFALVTTYFLITAVATTKILTVLFGLLTAGFYLVAAATFTGNSTAGTAAGWVLFLDALVALYLAAGLTVNAAWNRTVLPTP